MKLAISSPLDLGLAIRAERKKLGLTQTELAVTSGVSLRFISELERGRATAGTGRVLRVLKMLGIQVFLESPDSSSNR